MIAADVEDADENALTWMNFSILRKLGYVVTRTSQEGFGPTAKNSIRQRSNYRLFLRRTVEQSYRVTMLVLVV